MHGQQNIKIYNLGYRNYAKYIKQTENAKRLLHISANQCQNMCPFCSFQSWIELGLECNYVIQFPVHLSFFFLWFHKFNFLGCIETFWNVKHEI